ncbi:MAG: response regulator [Ignavibacteriales bacterium]
MSTARPHALIVDDHSTSALALKSALSVMGYATFGFASTGHQAVAAARARKPDLVITSLSLREHLDASLLSELDQEIEGVPVIYMADAGIAAEGDLVLQKPIGRAALSRALESLRGEEAAA